jgi:CPA2 family monovalent cation:H+ antiporter-2
MPHTQNLTALALVLAAAVFCGLAMNRLRLPSAAGFILVGMLLGPTGLGLIARSGAIETLANLGVLMLLFILGMELKLESFRRLLPLALGIAAAEIVAAVSFTLLLSQLTSGETTSAIVIGFMLAISSTAIAMKMMEDADEKQTPAGRLTLAVLVAQDLAVVPLLLVTNALAPGTTGAAILGVAVKLVFALALLAGLIWVLTRVKSFRFPWSEAILKDFDVGTLTVIGVCFTAATVSGLLGLSPALGAFLAGLAVGHSTLARQAVRMAQPVQSLLLFVFFLSIGLLIDLDYLLHAFWLILIALAVVAVGKTFVNLLILRLFGQSGDVAFPAALFLAPVGEFSFVIVSAGVSVGALTPEGHKLAIAVIALSLLVSPLWFIGARRAHDLAMRGITEADALFKQSYARELFLLRLWGKRAAGIGAQAATVAAAAGSAAATRATDYYRDQQAKRTVGAATPGAREPKTGNPDYEPLEGAWGDVPSPNIHPEAGVTKPSNDPS